MRRLSRRFRFAPFIALIALCCVVVAQPAWADRWVVSASADVSGSAGTNWRTDLRIVNTEDSGVTVRVYLLKNGQNNASLDTFVDVPVPADGQVQLDNVLSSSFSFSGTGALLIEAPGDDLVVTSRTYNQVTGGTYGQFIPGVPVELALAAGEDGYLVYLAKSGNFRSNLGWAGTTVASGTIRVTLYNAGGSQIGTVKTYDVQPYGQNQINDIFAAASAPATETAYAVVRPTVPVVAYASAVLSDRTRSSSTVMSRRLNSS